jgi:hypothetical protein
MAYTVFCIVAFYVLLFAPFAVLVATRITYLLPASTLNLHKSLQFAANSTIFLIGDLIALIVGVNIGALTGGYFAPMTAASAAVLFGTNAFIVAIALRKGEFRRYSRRQFMLLSLIIYVTCLAFVISDASSGLLNLH